MNFNMSDSVTTDNVINCFSIRNDGDISRQLTDNVHFVTVELPKFRKSISSLESLSDRMIWLLRYMGSLKEVPEQFSDKSFEKLFDISNFAVMTYEEQIEYLNKFHEELDRNSELETAISKGLEQGRAEGEAKGRAEGEAKGRAEGEAKGRTEANKETARKLKQAGADIDMISSCTGLSVEEIEAL